MLKKIHTIVIGAGQAGLASSYYLTKSNIEHIILEKDVVASTWMNKRWDSFTLVTPNWMNRLPSAPIIDDNPNAFLSREQVIQYLENYAKHIQAPIQENTEVLSVIPHDEKFLVKTSQGDFEAKNVIIATSIFNHAYMPAISQKIPRHIQQLHSEDYKNPSQLLGDGVLVVGSAQSGAQIAEELLEAGNRVYLATSKTGRVPRRYRGKDSSEWMALLGMPEKPAISLSTTQGKFPANPHISGKNGGHTLHLKALHEQGLTLLGTLDHYQDEYLYFKNNVQEHLDFADQFEKNLLIAIDDYILLNHLNVPEEKLPTYSAIISTIDKLSLTDISSIIWATGYRFDYSWIKADVFDEYGYPNTQQGISTYPGLYFVGLHGTHKVSSGLLYGVTEVAEQVVSKMK